jgi:hypothetical protein
MPGRGGRTFHEPVGTPYQKCQTGEQGQNRDCHDLFLIGVDVLYIKPTTKSRKVQHPGGWDFVDRPGAICDLSVPCALCPVPLGSNYLCRGNPAQIAMNLIFSSEKRVDSMYKDLQQHSAGLTSGRSVRELDIFFLSVQTIR